MLPIGLLQQIRAIEPSVDRGVAYLPCSVALRDGTVHERVYLIDAEDFARTWGHVSGQYVVAMEALVRVAENPERLPARFANRLYAAGESGMGYFQFVLEFGDGTAQAYVTGDAVDFLAYPGTRKAADVSAVVPHAKGTSGSYLEGLPYLWCPIIGLHAVLADLRPAAPWWRFWTRPPAT